VKRHLARTAYWLAGQLSRIRTPQRFYTWHGPDDDFSFAGWRWSYCGLSMKLLGLSQQLDWDHWDHWATVPGDCDTACAECGGNARPVA